MRNEGALEEATYASLYIKGLTNQWRERFLDPVSTDDHICCDGVKNEWPQGEQIPFDDMTIDLLLFANRSIFIDILQCNVIHLTDFGNEIM